MVPFRARARLRLPPRAPTPRASGLRLFSCAGELDAGGAFDGGRIGVRGRQHSPWFARLNACEFDASASALPITLASPRQSSPWEHVGVSPATDCTPPLRAGLWHTSRAASRIQFKGLWWYAIWMWCPRLGYKGRHIARFPQMVRCFARPCTDIRLGAGDARIGPRFSACMGTLVKDRPSRLIYADSDLRIDVNNLLRHHGALKIQAGEVRGCPPHRGSIGTGPN